MWPPAGGDKPRPDVPAPPHTSKGWIVKAGEIGIPRLNWLFRPFLATQKGACRRLNKKTGVKKGNMEGASARHKTGRCGHRPLR